MIDHPIKVEPEFLFGKILIYNKRYASILLFERTSPNGKYKIAWGQNDYYVYDARSERLLTCGHRCVNIFMAYIADNGYFLLEEWLNKFVLGGRITIRFFDGEPIYQKEFPLNILTSTLSENGTFAAVSLCNGNSYLKNKLVLIDLREDISKAVAISAIATADKITSFNVNEGIITMQASDNIGYRYSIDGIFLDAEKYTINTESKLVGKEALKAAKKHLDSIGSKNINDYAYAISLLQRSLQDILLDKDRANVYRYLGDIQLRCGNKQIAINAYKNALSLNDKVGVKTILKKLQNETGMLK